MVTIVFSIALSAQSAFEKAKQFVAERDFENAAQQIILALRDSPNNVNVLVLAGDIYKEIEQPEISLQNYKRAYDQGNINSYAARKYALALSSRDRHEQAIEIMRKAVKNDRNDVYNQLTLGEVLVEADSLNTAELIITKAREMNKKIPDGFLALGNLYYKQRVYELARDNYEQALKIDSTNIPALERLGTVYFKMANAETDNALANELYTRSLRQWGAITRLDPKNARAFFEQGKIFFYAQRFASAAPSLAEYIRLRPDADNAAIAHWYLAQSYERIRECDSAEPHLRFAIEKIDSVKSKALTLLARCAFDTKKYKQCTEAFNQLVASGITLDANDKERFGYAYINSGDTAKAIEQIRAAVEENPTKCKTAERLANLYYDQKKYDDAIAMYRRRMQGCPDSNNARMFAFIGRSFYSANQIDSALAYLNQAIAHDPASFFARVLAIKSLVSAKKISDAKGYYKVAMDYASRDYSKYKTEIGQMASTICQGYLEAKDYAEIQKITKQWVEIDKSSEFGWLYLAVAYQGLLDKDAACKCYREVLKINPNNEVAKKNMKSLGCP